MQKQIRLKDKIVTISQCHRGAYLDGAHGEYLDDCGPECPCCSSKGSDEEDFSISCFFGCDAGTVIPTDCPLEDG